MFAAIVIPARYASERLPGKPLIPVAGVALVERVWRIALAAAAGRPGTRALVATDHGWIMDFARDRGIDAVLTDPACPSGADRVLAGLEAREWEPDIVVNLQGDNPFCPPHVVASLLDECVRRPDVGVTTPAVRLSWEELDALRARKLETPFSGTLAVFAPEEPEAPLAAGRALFFSKREIPALRREKEERERSPLASPLYSHIGLYAYRLDALRWFAQTPPGRLEQLESLEQLRFLEHGVPVRVRQVDLRGRPWMSGIDSPKDLALAESYFAQHGELR